jgi:hypothetical protein
MQARTRTANGDGVHGAGYTGFRMKKWVLWALLAGILIVDVLLVYALAIA